MKKSISKPTAIDLFSGAGGLSHGFISAGFHVSASVEIDKLAMETQRYNHHRWKQYRTMIFNDNLKNTAGVLAKLRSIGVESVDVVIGGPPCQGFSRSNMRTRRHDNPDNDLFKQFICIVDALRPKVTVMENVGDLEIFEHGETVDEIISTFKSIGYKVEKEILNAVNYGVPQKRKRIFFIGVRDGIKIIFPNPKNTEPSRFVTVWEAISDLPDLENGNTIEKMPYRTDNLITEYQKKMRIKNSMQVLNNLVTKNNEIVKKRYSFIPQGGNWRDIPDELMANYADKSRCHCWIYLRLPKHRPAVTITNYRKNMLIHPHQDRGLSVREAARLQSFPDDFVFLGGIWQQQQQVANAVPPLLAEAVAKSVRKMLGV